ncbi:FCD domain-containing protein [Rhizobium paknamense]|uniref:Pyruvate dehydrogenase complex repressor n=1 Tax=Rhizobium paknamense TaxID=1206817 RepID=A0ABU0IC42_9HYPH|nr:FCD domain-containing protein [Rhizobium paknamense]MDQ0455791.1 GntR family L-lactate dehydrogenase operon transcriptional regulator [Rhizobium paknamense]
MSLAEKIEALIAERGLAPGDRLPPERQLAVDFGASRSRLREAIQTLISRGVLKSRQGGGTFVATPEEPGALDRALLPLLPLLEGEAGYWRDVMEIRKSLDGDAAYYAAQRATEANRQQIRSALVAMAEAGDDPARQALADAGFHRVLAEASHNIVLRQIVAGLAGLLRQSIAESLLRLYRQPDLIAALERQHRSIAEAVLAGEAEAARRAAIDHLQFVEDSLKAIEDGLARQKRARAALTRSDFQETTPS